MVLANIEIQEVGHRAVPESFHNVAQSTANDGGEPCRMYKTCRSPKLGLAIIGGGLLYRSWWLGPWRWREYRLGPLVYAVLTRRLSNPRLLCDRSAAPR